MANVHIRQVEDARGDLVDLLYWHHECSPADVLGWPAPEALDYPVYCEGCDNRIYEVPLTDEGWAARLDEAGGSGRAVAVSLTADEWYVVIEYLDREAGSLRQYSPDDAADAALLDRASRAMARAVVKATRDEES